MAATGAIQIGELSRRTGCNIETIRYYERIGLLPAPPRRGRYRSYGREDVARLGFARRAMHEAMQRAHGRRMFGHTLADFQLTQKKIGEMAVAIDAARAGWLPPVAGS